MPTKPITCDDMRSDFLAKSTREGICCCKCPNHGYKGTESCIKRGQLKGGWKFEVCCIVLASMQVNKQFNGRGGGGHCLVFYNAVD